jgi:hypothetical protein
LTDLLATVSSKERDRAPQPGGPGAAEQFAAALFHHCFEQKRMVRFHLCLSFDWSFVSPTSETVRDGRAIWLE